MNMEVCHVTDLNIMSIAWNNLGWLQVETLYSLKARIWPNLKITNEFVPDGVPNCSAIEPSRAPSLCEIGLRKYMISPPVSDQGGPCFVFFKILIEISHSVFKCFKILFWSLKFLGTWWAVHTLSSALSPPEVQRTVLCWALISKESCVDTANLSAPPRPRGP